MTVTISTLVDNTASFGFLAEWGLSLLVEVDGRRVLFDTGMGKAIAHNAGRMSVDLRDVDAVVLSHGHVDHTGGLGRVLSRTGTKPVIAHPDIWSPKFSVRSDGSTRNIGMPFSKNDLESLGAVFTEVTRPTPLSPDITLSGEIHCVTTFERVDGHLFRDTGDGITPDPLYDDLSMAVKTDAGLVIVLGCAHLGPINIIRHFQSVTGVDRVYAVVGGLHLGHASVERIDNTISHLKSLGVQIIACSHCTGFKAAARLAEAFGDGFLENHAGQRLTF